MKRVFKISIIILLICAVFGLGNFLFNYRYVNGKYRRGEYLNIKIESHGKIDFSSIWDETIKNTGGDEDNLFLKSKRDSYFRTDIDRRFRMKFNNDCFMPFSSDLVLVEGDGAGELRFIKKETETDGRVYALWFWKDKFFLEKLEMRYKIDNEVIQDSILLKKYLYSLGKIDFSIIENDIGKFGKKNLVYVHPVNIEREFSYRRSENSYLYSIEDGELKRKEELKNGESKIGLHINTRCGNIKKEIWIQME